MESDIYAKIVATLARVRGFLTGFDEEKFKDEILELRKTGDLVMDEFKKEHGEGGDRT